LFYKKAQGQNYADRMTMEHSADFGAAGENGERLLVELCARYHVQHRTWYGAGARSLPSSSTQPTLCESAVARLRQRRPVSPIDRVRIFPWTSVNAY